MGHGWWWRPCSRSSHRPHTSSLSLPLYLRRARAHRRPLAIHPLPLQHEPNLPSPIAKEREKERSALTPSLSLPLLPLRRYKRRWTRWNIPPSTPRFPTRSLGATGRWDLSPASSAYGVLPLCLASHPLVYHQRPSRSLLPAVPGTARCYPRAIRACAIYPFVRRAVPSPHPLPASRSPASTSACASAAIKARSVATTRAYPAPHWSSGTSERS